MSINIDDDKKNKNGNNILSSIVDITDNSQKNNDFGKENTDKNRTQAQDNQEKNMNQNNRKEENGEIELFSKDNNDHIIKEEGNETENNSIEEISNNNQTVKLASDNLNLKDVQILKVKESNEIVDEKKSNNKQNGRTNQIPAKVQVIEEMEKNVHDSFKDTDENKINSTATKDTDENERHDGYFNDNEKENSYNMQYSTPSSDSASPSVINTDNDNANIEDVSKRRITACNRCHSLKVKCVPTDPTTEFSTCKRCLKKNVLCQYNLVPKKKKAIPLTNTMKIKIKDNEIKKLKDELQRKDHLIKVLRGFTDDEEKKMVSEMSSHERLEMYRKEIQELESISKGTTNTSQFVLNSERRVQICQAEMSSLDIIGNNLLTYSQCAKLLNIFVTKIHPRYPLVDLPTNLSIEYLRKNEPLLFIIMIYIGTTADVEPSDVCIEAQLQLECLISKSISQEILLIGNKTIQLLKCTLLYCIWYIPPELFHHRRYHMFSALCVSLAHDLGISGRPFFFYNKDDGSVKKASVVNNDRGIDLKALVLVVYVVYMSISLFLKRIVFLQWTEYLDQSCQILENSNIRCYKMIALYARMNHLMEIIYRNVHKSSEQTTVLELSSNKNKLQLSGYLEQINKLKHQILNSFELNSPDYNSLMAYLYSIQAYVYEPALQTLISSKEYITPEYKDVFFSTLSQICESCLLSLKHFNQLSIDEITSNPLFHTSRILYTSGMLLRIRYLSLTIPKSGKACLFTDECILNIKKLTDKIEDTAKKYPKNHFIKKIGIVLGLFIHTCLSQWYISYKSLLDDIRMHTPLFADPIYRNNTPYTANHSNIRNEVSKEKNNSNTPILTIPTMNGVNTNNSNNSKRRKIEYKSVLNTMSTNVNNSKTFKPHISSLLQQNDSELLSSPTSAMVNRSDLLHQQKNSPLYSVAHSPPTPVLYLGSNAGSSHDANSTPSGSDTPAIKFTPNVTTEENRNFNPNTYNLNALGISQSGISTNNGHNRHGTDKSAENPQNNWEFQYMAFNDEFWSDLFFGNGENNNEGNVTNIENDTLNLNLN